MGKVLLHISMLLNLIFGLCLSADEIKIGVVTSEIPPYNYRVDGEQFGYTAELVKLILEELDIRVEHHFIPTKDPFTKQKVKKIF